MLNKILSIIAVILLVVSISLYHIDNKNIKEKEETKNDLKEEVEEDYVVHIDNENLKINDYIIRVVATEMPASFNFEALKAQAIATRSFLLYNANSFDLYPSKTSQAYSSDKDLKTKWGNDYDKYYNKIKDAVLATDNLVMKYNDRIIKSYYYAISNGTTEDSLMVFNEDLPYLNVIDSSIDKEAKNYLYQKEIAKDEFCSKLNIDCNYFNVENIVVDDSGRVSSIIINNKKFSGIEVRKKLDLRSTDFSIEENNNKIIITTKGYGHGVGMSQYGANLLANKGYTYEDILKYYYQNIEIKSI